jgi:hypothetical protein
VFIHRIDEFMDSSFSYKGVCAGAKVKFWDQA